MQAKIFNTHLIAAILIMNPALHSESENLNSPSNPFFGLDVKDQSFEEIVRKYPEREQALKMLEALNKTKISINTEATLKECLIQLSEAITATLDIPVYFLLHADHIDDYKFILSMKFSSYFSGGDAGPDVAAPPRSAGEFLRMIHSDTPIRWHLYQSAFVIGDVAANH